MNIREAEKEDIKKMVPLLNKLVEPYKEKIKSLHSIKSVEEEFNRPKQFRPTYFVIEEDNNIKAVACVSLISNTCLIKEIIVEEKSKNKGLGRKLIEKIEEFALNNNCQKIWAYSAVTYNVKGFYEKLRYKQEGFLKNHFYEIDHYLFGKVL